MGNFGIWQLLIVALIVVLLFGTKKLRGIGGDLGGAVKGFKKAISDEDQAKADAQTETKALEEDAASEQPKQAAEQKKDEQA